MRLALNWHAYDAACDVNDDPLSLMCLSRLRLSPYQVPAARPPPRAAPRPGPQAPRPRSCRAARLAPLSDRFAAAIAGVSSDTAGTIRRRSTAEIARLHTRRGAGGRLRPVEGLRAQPGSRQSRRWGNARVLVHCGQQMVSTSSTAFGNLVRDMLSDGRVCRCFTLGGASFS
jgi:hypothetical protein